jgi:hypothetical protein
MLTVYADSQLLLKQWLPMITFGEPYTVSHDLTEYLNATGRRIAFTTCMLGRDIYPVTQLSTFDLVTQLSQSSELVFYFDIEMTLEYFNFWKQNMHPNVYYLTPAVINDPVVQERVIFWAEWFNTSTALYKELPDVLATIDPYAIKPKYFDALLGLKKLNRTHIYNSINDNKLNDQVIMSYDISWYIDPETKRYNYPDNSFYAEKYFIWEPGTKIPNPIRRTANIVEYKGQFVRLSQIIPVKVYNDTAYSIIGETEYRDQYSFYTEKTAKAMIARRLFVVFSGLGFLKNLHSLGFQTFDGIIDESYDLEEDVVKRWNQAFEQVKYLCGCNQADIYAKIKPIVEHNYNLIMSQDWTQLAADKITDIIKHAH